MCVWRGNGLKTICVLCRVMISCVFSLLSPQALKWENDLYELTRKANQESSGQPENPSEITETDQTPDKSLQPLQCVLHRKPFVVILSTDVLNPCSFCLVLNET